MNLDRFSLLGLAPEDMITLMAGLAAFLVVLAVWNGLLARDPMAGRVKMLKARREFLHAGMMAPKRRLHKFEAIGLMRALINRFDLMRGQQAERIGQRLARAGWRSKDATVVFLFFKIFLPFAFGAVAAFAVYGIGLYDLPPMGRLLTALVAVLGGAYVPEIYVRNRAAKRRKALQKGIPDALDLMVICTEAGLGLDAALHKVASEIGPNSPELADELGLTAIELGFLPERRTALANLVARTDLAAIRGVVNTLAQTEKYGTPLAASLRVLASEYRGERMLRAEAKAAKLPATLTIPMIIFILPTLFVVLLGPAVILAIDGLGGL